MIERQVRIGGDKINHRDHDVSLRSKDAKRHAVELSIIVLK
jgi:hypothetical protein